MPAKPAKRKAQPPASTRALCRLATETPPPGNSSYRWTGQKVADGMELALPELLREVRRLGQRNLWVEGVLLAKQGFGNHAIHLAPDDPQQAAAFKTWLKTRNARGVRNSAAVKGFVRDAWAEWFLMDNLIAFWRDNGQPPILLPPEAVEYDDALGVESLKWLGADGARLRALARDGQLPASSADRYSRPVQLDPAFGEYYAVLRRGARGRGLARPRLGRCLEVGTQAESMQAGEAIWALAGRQVIRQHVIGFEVKTSALAPHQVDFLYDDERAEAIQGQFQHKQGLIETVSQFDHVIKHLWSGSDPKAYDGRKWTTITERLAVWAGPLGQLLLLPGQWPQALVLLRTEMEAEREWLQEYLEDVLTEAMHPPGGLRLSWGRRCFADLRLAWQQVKDLMTQGPLSLQTALREGGFDAATEGEQKEAEAPAKTNARYLPKWDPSHGQRPGSGGGTGRPPTRDVPP
jgi:hypothetical protein